MVFMVLDAGMAHLKCIKMQLHFVLFCTVTLFIVFRDLVFYCSSTNIAVVI